jgi:phosphoadenosine phosphosulfate reductase
LSENEIGKLASRFEKSEPIEVLRWALDTYHPKIALASSFGAEDVVLIDMLSSLKSDVKIFTLDTGRLPQETYDVMDAVRRKYGFQIEVYFPATRAIEDMVNKYGLNPFYHSVNLRKVCCNVRKVEPLRRALSGLNAWITGLRREQAFTRASIPKVVIDKDHRCIVKVNPLADWSGEQVWRYIRAHNVPYNKLHDRGYSSIGCAPCTRAVASSEDFRAGRWWWERGVKECGLHYQEKKGSVNKVVEW